MSEKLKKQSVIISLIWAFVGTIGVVYYIKIGTGMDVSPNYANNIIYYFIYAASAFSVYYCCKVITKKKAVFAGILSLLFACICIIGAQIEYLRAINWLWITWIKVLCLAIFLFPLFVLLIYILDDCRFKAAESCVKNISKWKIFLAIIVIWGIAYLAMFPGIYDYDSIDQTLQFLVTGNVSGHHPVLHSLLLSGFMKIGYVVFHSYEIGLGIFTLLQVLFLAYAAMKVAWFLLQKGYNRLFWFTMCFYLCFPLHYIMSVWDTKDSIFAGFFVLVSLSLIEMADRTSGFWDNRWNLVKFVLYVVLMCMFRNNGLYALILLIPICFFCFKERRKATIILFMLSMLIYVSYQNILLPSLGVKSGNIREMMSIPCQQLAKVYVETPEAYTDEEKEALLELIPEKNIMDYQYRPMISDATKNYLNSEVLKSDLPKYGKLYVSIGLKSPRKYIEAFLQNSCGFWYPNKSYPDERMFHPYTEFDMADPNLFKGDYIYLERMSLFPQYEEILRPFFQSAVWKKIPIVSNFFVPGTYFIVLLFGISASFYRKNYKQLFVFGFWGAYWFTLLISPVALVRYAYPVIMCLPLMLSLITQKGLLSWKRERKNTKNG